MSSINSIAPDKLARLVGTPKSPRVVDVRADEDVANDPFLIPASVRRSHDKVSVWASALGSNAAVVVCHHGLDLSHGVGAWLRSHHVAAEVLEGGHEAWRKAGLPLVPIDKIPPRSAEGRTVWVIPTVVRADS